MLVMLAPQALFINTLNNVGGAIGLDTEALMEAKLEKRNGSADSAQR